jgi:hypothetical protein
MASSEIEMQLVESALEHVEFNRHRFEPLMRVGLQTHPIPFFGSLNSARVVTLGLNPSSGEFITSRQWPTSITSSGLTERLVGYFNSTLPPPHRWFEGWSDALTRISSTYQTNAAHLDLSPRATRGAGQFHSPAEKALFIEMLRYDAPLWISALENMPQLRLVMAAGSVTNAFYINEFIAKELAGAGVKLVGPWRRRGGQGQTAMQALCLPSGREIPFFFCSTGPTCPSVLANAVGTLSTRLSQLVSTQGLLINST